MVTELCLEVSVSSVALHEPVHCIDQDVQSPAGLSLRLAKLADQAIRLSHASVSLLAIIGQRHANVNQFGDILAVLLGKPGCFGLAGFHGLQIGPELGLLPRHVLFPGIKVEGHQQILTQQQQ